MKSTGWFLGLGLISAVALALPACGDDDDKGSGDGGDRGGEGNATSQGGASAGRDGGGGRSGGAALGGAGGALPNVSCGDTLCTPRTLPGYPGVAACCADEAASQCGLDTSLLETFGGVPTRACEPLDQPGELDDDCPVSPAFQQGAFTLPPFAGCCNAATGKCGYRIDRVLDVLPIGLGCVDATPFLDGAEPAPCDPSAAGGANGAGGGAGGSAG